MGAILSNIWYVKALLNLFINNRIALPFSLKHLNLPSCEGNGIQNGKVICLCHLIKMLQKYQEIRNAGTFYSFF